ncbi:histidine phosphatase family protein [Patescibacteria group bacterium]|nr:histidine phosphatase family protein [Patescibacteria group bacterium]
MNDLKITTVRVGSAFYQQNERSVTIETADDLSIIGKKQMQETAEDIAFSMQSNEKVLIFTSASPRALETSRIIFETLQNRNIFNGQFLAGISTQLNDTVKELFLLNEIKNFDPIVLRWLLHGTTERVGKLESGGSKVRSNVAGNRAATNPENLNQTDYLENRYWEHVCLDGLALELRKKLHTVESKKKLLERVAKIEPWLVKESMKEPLTKNNPKHYILVSHLAILQTLTGKTNINPGEHTTKILHT